MEPRICLWALPLPVSSKWDREIIIQACILDRRLPLASLGIRSSTMILNPPTTTLLLLLPLIIHNPLRRLNLSPMAAPIRPINRHTIPLLSSPRMLLRITVLRTSWLLQILKFQRRLISTTRCPLPCTWSSRTSFT